MIALGTDLAVLSAWSNDIGWEEGLARQVEALGRPGDLLLALSTSGTSPNVVRAVEAARAQGLRTLAFTGGDGGLVRDLADHAVIVPSRDTQAIQEVHGLLIHLVSEVVERRLVDAGWFGPGVRADSAPAAASSPTGDRSTRATPSGARRASPAPAQSGRPSHASAALADRTRVSRRRSR
jgi:hypothetical protein